MHLTEFLRCVLRSQHGSLRDSFREIPHHWQLGQLGALKINATNPLFLPQTAFFFLFLLMYLTAAAHIFFRILICPSAALFNEVYQGTLRNAHSTECQKHQQNQNCSDRSHCSAQQQHQNATDKAASACLRVIIAQIPVQMLTASHEKLGKSAKCQKHLANRHQLGYGFLVASV